MFDFAKYKKDKLITFLLTFTICLAFILVKNFIITKILNITISENIFDTFALGDYGPQVMNILKHGSFINSEGNVMNYYPPIFPLYLSLLYKIFELVNIPVEYIFYFFTTIIISTTSVYVFNLTKEIFRSRKMAYFSIFIFTTHPYVLQGLTKVMSVTFFNFFFIISLWYFFVFITGFRKKNISVFLAGLFMGFAILTRAIGVFLPIVYILIILINQNTKGNFYKLRISFFIAVSCFIVILPWEIYNYKYSREVILITKSGPNAYLDGINFNYHPHKQKLKLPEDVNKLTKDLLKIDPKESQFFKKTFKLLSENPVATAKLLSFKAIRSWFGTFGQNWKKERIKLFLFVIYMFPCFVFLFIKVKNKKVKVFKTIFILTSLYFWGITTIVISIVRYMIPVFVLGTIIYPYILKNLLQQFQLKRNIS